MALSNNPDLKARAFKVVATVSDRGLAYAVEEGVGSVPSVV